MGVIGSVTGQREEGEVTSGTWDAIRTEVGPRGEDTSSRRPDGVLIGCEGKTSTWHGGVLTMLKGSIPSDLQGMVSTLHSGVLTVLKGSIPSDLRGVTPT